MAELPAAYNGPATRQLGERPWQRMSYLRSLPTRGFRDAQDLPKRAEAFKQMAETFGATVKELFWTQGRYDIVTIVEAPDEISILLRLT